MTPIEQELMERYIYQVTRRLPKGQRNEVGLELQELIGDMLDEIGSMEEVLTRLGNPGEFAKKYQDTTHYLIGPEYYDTYVWLLKIVVLCTIFAILGASILLEVRDTFNAVDKFEMSTVIGLVFSIIIRFLGEGIISCLGAVGCVTLIFTVIERQKIQLDIKQEKEWTVADLGENFAGKQKVWTPQYLSPIPHKKAMISRGESITGIVFITIFCILLIVAPNFFSAILRENDKAVVIPVFNLEKWNIILPVFVFSLLIALADEIVRLVTGCYCKLVMFSSIISNVLQMILCVIVLKVFPFWNPNFAAEVKFQLGKQLDGFEKFLTNWNSSIVSNIIIAFIILVSFIEIGVTIYKTLRYGSDR